MPKQFPVKKFPAIKVPVFKRLKLIRSVKIFMSSGPENYTFVFELMFNNSFDPCCVFGNFMAGNNLPGPFTYVLGCRILTGM